jgi:hypothetical protein
MARRRSLVSRLYRTARLANDVSVLASGNPHRIARRAKNTVLGRTLARGGSWRPLWGGGRTIVTNSIRVADVLADARGSGQVALRLTSAE